MNWSSHFDFIKKCLEKYPSKAAAPTATTTAADPAPPADQPATTEVLQETSAAVEAAA